MISNIPITPKSPSDPCFFRSPSFDWAVSTQPTLRAPSTPMAVDGLDTPRSDATSDLWILGEFSTSPGAND